ncbi:MAG TPA: phosphotransferase [Gemmataceae bacterium]|nr:phosphotransferase [Gemmataceae bacterium]
MMEPALFAVADRLARQAGLGAARSGQQLTGGANNRVFRIDTAGGPALLKAYFRSERDPRNRYGAELSFLQFARHCGIDCVAQPLAHDEAAGVLLQEWLPGRRPEAAAIDFAAVQQAVDFLTRLNEQRDTAMAGQLPAASEACFRVVDHVRTVDRRVGRLTELAGQTSVDLAAKAFVSDELLPTWQRLAASIPQDECEAPLPPVDRCLSPSDFGFHNVLMDDAGRCRFVDFEYAGWDDPAKTVIDFFSQPTLGVSQEHLPYFLERIGSYIGAPEALHGRVKMLWPVYRVKWCCIVLNIFHAVDAGPRRFAGADADALRGQHLERARALWRTLTD